MVILNQVIHNNKKKYLRVCVRTNFHLTPQFPEIRTLPQPPIKENNLQYRKQLLSGCLAENPSRPHSSK